MRSGEIVAVTDGRMKTELWHHVKGILDLLGYDPSDPHFRKTPVRVAEWLAGFIANGDPADVGPILEVVFPVDTPQDLVIVGPTEYHSMCAHHMLPVEGSAWLGYLPNERICGLSKLSRLVEYFANQLTVQEKVTAQIADAMEMYLKPKGSMIVIRASHSCMTFRGIRDRDVSATTSAVRGLFKESDALRSEFLALVR